MLHLSQPKWLDSQEPRQYMHIRCSVTLTNGTAGVAFRIADIDNYYAVVLDATAKTSTLIRVTAGVAMSLAAAPWPVSGVFTSVALVVDIVVRDSGIVASIPAMSMNLTSTDAVIALGTVGLLSAGVSSFDDLLIDTTCDGSGLQCTTPTSVSVNCHAVSQKTQQQRALIYRIVKAR
jgi:hypothetical protein